MSAPDALTPEQRADRIAKFELIAHSPEEWFAKMTQEIREAELAGYRARDGEVGHRVLVCGGRDARDHRPIYDALDKLRPVPDLIITGGALGVDVMAEQWAASAGIPCAVFKPYWDKFGKAAGGLRNSWMLRFGQPTLVVAFPGGSGTANMVQKARAHSVPVVEPMALRGAGEREQ